MRTSVRNESPYRKNNNPDKMENAFISISKGFNAQGEREWTISEAAAGNTDLLAAALLDELERGSGPLRPALELAVRGRALRNPNPGNNPGNNSNNPDKTPNA